MLPDGRYQADLDRVRVESDKRGHHLVLEAVTDHAVRLVARQPLAREGEDPYRLASSQLPAWRQFAGRLGIDAKGRPVEQVVGVVSAMGGQRVVVRVRQTPVGAHCRMMLAEGTVATGEILPVAMSDATAAAHDTHERLLAAQAREQAGFADVCRASFELRETDGWARLGYRSIGEYLAQPEVTMRRSSFYERAAIWEWYVVTGGLDPARLSRVGWYKLKVTLGAVIAGRVDAGTAIDDGVALAAGDLRAKYRNLGELESDISDSSTPGSQERPAPAPGRRDERAQRRMATALAALLRAIDRRAAGDELGVLVAEARDALGPFMEWAT